MVTPGAKREAVAHAREHHGVSERRACALVGVSRRIIRYEPSRPDDGALRQRLRELAAERRWFGYRRLGYLLAREGITPNHKKLLRIYPEEGLRVRRRGGRKRALGMRRPIRAGRLAARLQHGQTTLETGREDPRREHLPTCLGACSQTRCHPIRHPS